MKPSLLLTLFLLVAVPSRAADDARLAVLRGLDDQRTAATVAADEAKLKAIFSDELHYAHSTGTIDTKTSYLASIISGRTKYRAIDFQERKFTFPVKGMALESGRVHMKTSSASGETDAIFSFLAVWREEKGQWRFLAWQSCKLPPATPDAKAK